MTARTRRTCVAACRLLVMIVTAGLASSCRSTHWSDSYIGARDPDAARAAEQGRAGQVTVRSVPWERVQTTLDELTSEIAASDTHPDEWSQERRDAAKAKLLKGLQVSEPSEQVVVLGHSRFRTTDPVRPETPEGEAELVAFAQRLGADTVVWAGRSLGKVDRIVKEPVTTFSTGSDWPRTRGGYSRPSSFSETTTTWIPVRVQMDEIGYIAYFVRRAR